MNQSIQDIISGKNKPKYYKDLFNDKFAEFNTRKLNAILRKTAKDFGGSAKRSREEKMKKLDIVKSVIKKAEQIQEAPVECMICLENVQPSNLFITNCCHVFCINCFLQYVINYSKTNCPVCRKMFDTKMEFEKISADIFAIYVPDEVVSYDDYPTHIMNHETNYVFTLKIYLAIFICFIILIGVGVLFMVA